MDDVDEQDACVAQLREVFESCDVKNSGYLGPDELALLCHRLQFADQATLLVRHLLGDDPQARVNFEEFKEGFVTLLTQAGVVPGESSASAQCQDISDTPGDREVSPKFVLGEKKYGRRSRPVSQADDDDAEVPSDCSDNEVLSVSETGDGPVRWTDVSTRRVKDSSSRSIFLSKSPSEPTPIRKLSFSSNAFSFCGSPSGQAGGAMADTFEVGSSSHRGSIGGPAGSTGAESDSSLTLLETNPEEYLRGIWKKLGVGRDGYLNLDELTGVCEHIGMEMTDEMITQLFDTLDCDQDGKVSFEEFLQGLFQHGRPASAASVSSTPSQPASTPVHGSPAKHLGSAGGAFNADSQEDHPMTTPSWESGIFSSIDPENTGYAEPQAILSLWESVGLTGGSRLLKQLGFNLNLKINLQDLTSHLEEELTSASSGCTCQFALGTYQHELQHLKTHFEQAREERDRLRVSITEANTRAALLAQEVDDHHAKLEKSSQKKLITLEKKYQEQLREMQEELQREREANTMQLSRFRQQSQADLTSIRNEENKLRLQYTSLEQENRRLEQELQEMSEKYLELHRHTESQQKEVEAVAQLRQRIADMESGQTLMKEEKYQSILEELETLRKQNKELQDNIDELRLECETLHQQLANTSRPNTKRHRRSGSWLADYNSRPGSAGSGSGALKRRGSGSSTEESDDDSPIAGKIRRRGMLYCPTSTGDEGNRLSFEAEKLNDVQQEAFERLRAEYGRTLQEVEENCRQRVAELEAQLGSQSSQLLQQPEVDKDSIDVAQSVIAKLQDELDAKNQEVDQMKSEVAELQLCLQQEKDRIADELKRSEAEVARSVDSQVHQVQLANDELRRELMRKEEEMRRRLQEMKEQTVDRLKLEYDERMEGIKSEVERQLVHRVRNEVERELRTTLEQSLRIQSIAGDNLGSCTSNHRSGGKLEDDLTIQLTEDICTLLRACLRSTNGDSQSDPTGSSTPSLSPGPTGCLQDELAGLIGRTLKAIETHLETLHLQEQERLKQHWEEEVTRLRQEHMIEKLDSELRHKEDLQRFQDQHHHRNITNQGTESEGPSRTDTLLRDMYVENSRILKALQVSEEGRQRAEHNSTRLQYKCKVLSKLVSDITRATNNQQKQSGAII